MCLGDLVQATCPGMCKRTPALPGRPLLMEGQPQFPIPSSTLCLLHSVHLPSPRPQPPHCFELAKQDLSLLDIRFCLPKQWWISRVVLGPITVWSSASSTASVSEEHSSNSMEPHGVTQVYFVLNLSIYLSYTFGSLLKCMQQSS